MEPITNLPESAAKELCGVFTDIDDTMTSEGKLRPEAYDAAWQLREAGLRFIPVTGRPAGWCDMIARFWPVDAVVGENGALVFFEVAGDLRRFFHPDVADGETRARLDAVREDVLKRVPGSRVAKDQPYRLFDLAIDFCEEPPDLGLEAAEEIRTIFLKHGAQAKISSIHVNGWFGDYDKLTTTKLFMNEQFGVDLEADKHRYLFCGDSPNDEPMFGFFPHASAVANIAPFASSLKQLPRYVASHAGGEGFAEIVATILKKRGG